MVEGLDIGGMFASSATTAYNWVLYFIGIVVVATIIGVIWYMQSYNRRVILKVWTNTSSYLVMDKAREVTEGGVTYWKLWNLKVKAPIPPPGSVSIGNKGRRTATGYYTKDTGVIWSTDTTTRDTIESRILQAGLDPLTKGKPVEGAFQPLTTQERAMLADQTVRAQKRRGESVLERITQLATPIALLMIVFMGLIFWGDIAEPVQNLQESNAQISLQNAKISEQNARLMSQLTGGEVHVNLTQSITPPDVTGVAG